MNPLLERLQDQFVVKQCNHPRVDSAAIQLPQVWHSNLQKHPHPSFRDKRSFWMPYPSTDSTPGLHHFLTLCKTSQILAELSEQAIPLSICLDGVDKHDLLTSLAS